MKIGTMKRAVTRPARALFQKLGMDIVKYQGDLPQDFGPEICEIHGKVKPYTMTFPERVFAMCSAVDYIHNGGIAGDIVECGVWRGGSIMAAAYALLNRGDTDRDLYLYDTYEGMAEPTEHDVAWDNVTAETILSTSEKDEDGSNWCCASLEEVRRNVTSTGYDPARLHFVKGKVEDTIPGEAPQTISLLRLDTDWYESTRHSLIHLFPRVSDGGVLIIDDYGHWQGARKAVDEYFQEHGIHMLLNRIDYTGRMGIVHRGL